jgi:hypothetical protein
MSDTAWQSLFTNMPAILASLAALITATFTGFQAWRNGQKTDAAAAKADVATAAAAEAARTGELALTKTTEVHEQTQEIAKRAEKIAEQTDGQLSRLVEENRRLHTTLAQVMSILSAREGKVHAVRRDDVPTGQADLTDAVDELESPAGERRQAERRRS